MKDELISKVMDEVMKKMGASDATSAPAAACCSNASANCNLTEFVGTAIGVLLADTAVKAATVDVVGYSSPANGGTSFSNEVILTFTGDSGAVKQAIIAARDVGMQVLKTLEPSVELKSTTTPYIL